MKSTLIFLMIILLFSSSSCVVEKVQVGNYNSQNCNSSIYKKDKDLYLLWDAVPLRKSEKKLTIKNYEKITKRTFFDGLVYIGTAGIFSFYTIKIRIKECAENMPEEQTPIQDIEEIFQ